MVNYTLISHTRIEHALDEAWAEYGSKTVRARSIGNAWHQAALAHDYENTTGTLPEAVALWTSKGTK